MKDKLLELGYSEAQADLITNKKVYFQADIDNITEKVRNTETKRYNELLNENQRIKLESSFIINGGKKEAFEDFFNSTKQYDFTKDNAFETLKSEKPYFFNSVIPFDNKVDIEKERNQIKLEDNSDLYAGTIYKKIK